MNKKLCGETTIHYADEGQGDKVIVLLHGFCGSSSYWDDVIPLLSPHYRCIVPDLRGHGQSDAPKGAYSMEDMADDVLKLLEELGIPKVVLLGHSMGGYIALSAVQRHPERFSAFGLIHSTAHADTEEAKEKRLKAVSTIETAGITAFVDGLVPGLFAPQHLDSMADKVNKTRGIGYTTPPQGAAGAALAMRGRPDRRDVLTAAPLPVLLVAGENDQVIPIERTFTADQPNIQRSIISGAGHMSMMEAPQELAEVMKGFLEGFVE
ncbi:alpha/beta fold hydrolase [Paenibacillus sp. P96]|uniref:Alpha/beta fold hydrolase n=1 Tax=Paenibacillus zeirhizosphaerae TaxID=2987519 RepID=A0ABT9FTM5_9BACL|nr:alpha/beta fold hydrolase [Paenibacillus sp. P96]MDP4098084.1 alpha/beta fold hydrolase [Paenibacillus sp. P96]